jgi:hypothetical protein
MTAVAIIAMSDIESAFFIRHPQGFSLSTMGSLQIRFVSGAYFTLSVFVILLAGLPLLYRGLPDPRGLLPAVLFAALAALLLRGSQVARKALAFFFQS